MKVTMVGRDVAPSRALELVRKELLAKDVEVSAHLGGGKPLVSSPEQILDDVRSSNLVLIGMSCSEKLAENEIFAAKEALTAGVPYGFYADLFGCSSRAWFAPVREGARFVFVLSDEEARKTRALFPNAEVVVSGNPVIEDSFFNVSKPVSETRALLGLGDGELLMFCTAGKDLETNRANFKIVAEAVSLLPDRYRWRPLFMLHGGDTNEPNSSYYNVAQIEGIQTRLLPKKEADAMGLTALDVINACDLMVASVSTSGIEAACLRKPVVENLTPLAVARMKEQSGSDIWPPCEFGISRAVMGDPAELATAIQELMSLGGFDEMRARQEACFPVPMERGAAVKIMVDTVLKLIS